MLAKCMKLVNPKWWYVSYYSFEIQFSKKIFKGHKKFIFFFNMQLLRIFKGKKSKKGRKQWNNVLIYVLFIIGTKWKNKKKPNCLKKQNYNLLQYCMATRHTYIYVCVTIWKSYKNVIKNTYLLYLILQKSERHNFLFTLFIIFVIINKTFQIEKVKLHLPISTSSCFFQIW